VFLRNTIKKTGQFFQETDQKTWAAKRCCLSKMATHDTLNTTHTHAHTHTHTPHTRAKGEKCVAHNINFSSKMCGSQHETLLQTCSNDVKSLWLRPQDLPTLTLVNFGWTHFSSFLSFFDPRKMSVPPKTLKIKCSHCQIWCCVLLFECVWSLWLSLDQS
jgi:hypothetical protein